MEREAMADFGPADRFKNLSLHYLWESLSRLDKKALYPPYKGEWILATGRGQAPGRHTPTRGTCIIVYCLDIMNA
jgi:hypothetical protein